MRPRSIEIAGFTCFVKPITISFDGMDVFAITGRTGSGKTTIMDAMCYALYGKVPRGTDVSKLIAHDATKMHVSFEFEAGGERYRAARTIGISAKTMKTTPTTVQLERAVSGDEWEPLENRVREMNEAVERIVGLDYRAFTRCVLLPQGKFQEMLAGDASERRAVLEELLDIGVYERIMQSAGRQARELDSQAKALEQVLQGTFADATEEVLAARRKEHGERTTDLEHERANREALQAASGHVAEWRAARLSEREHRAALDAKTSALEAAETVSRDGEALVAQAAAEAAAADAELRALAYDRALHTKLGAARASAVIVERLRGEEQKAKEAAADSGRVTKAEAAARAAGDAEQAASAALKNADAELEGARREHAAAHLRAGLKAGDACPVCTNIVGKLTKTAAPALAATEKAQAAAKKAAGDASKEAMEKQQALALAKRDFEAAGAAAEKASGDLARARKELAALLPKGFDADLAGIDKKLAELNKLGERVDALTSLAAELRAKRDELEQSMREGRETIDGLRGETKSLAASADTEKRRGDEAISQLGAVVKKHGWKDVQAQIDAKQDPTKLLGAMLTTSQDECGRLEGRIGGLVQEIARIERDIEQAKEQRAKVEQLRREQGLFATLAEVLQATKFRDWYIGEAMAVLAEAAAERLQVLDPDDRYALQVNKGEFVVVDRWQASATRSPDTLSGGETFVVSLALALALAEQLPRIQSGTASPLESLFLDEGFGTLDADTLDQVMTAIEGLRIEGRLVGIVTHVRELAERIGTRIEVVKSPEGSAVRMVGAGV